MRFGVSLPNYGIHASRDALVAVAKAADELGYYSIWAAERLIVPRPPNQPWSKLNPTAYEPLMTLAFLAGITEKVKLGTNIVVAPFRRPLVLAKQAVALDRLSEGRLILGLGLGWMAEGFKAVGVPMEQRGTRTDETIHLLRRLWEEPNPSFEGKYTKFPQIHFEPKPAQRRVPIWIGGNSDAALRRAVELGDGWTPTSLDVDQLADRIGLLRKEATKRQRPLEQIVLSYNSRFDGTKDTSRMKQDLETYQNLGVNHFWPVFTFETLEELLDQMRIFAEQVMTSF